MSEMNFQKVFVQYRDFITPYDPVLNRKYTITHSDITADLFVTIASSYANDQVTEMQDDVKIGWEQTNQGLLLLGWVFIDGAGAFYNPEMRNHVFYSEMSKALMALRHADRFLFHAYPNINSTPVFFHFVSDNPAYDKIYNFGHIGSYALY